MMAKRIVPLSMAVSLGLALGSLPASAAQRGREPRGDQVALLAHRLERAADALYREAAELRHRRSGSHGRAVWALGRLERSARAFHARVERDGIRDRDSARAFEGLERAFRLAEARLDDLHTPRRRGVELRRDLARVERLMDELDRRLARGEPPHGRARGHAARGDDRGRDAHVARRFGR